MKSPAELKAVLRRQWENPSRREARLLASEGEWPFVVSIGRPTANRIRGELDTVKRHVDQWRQVEIGEVIWQSVRYRATDDFVDIPTGWKFSKPSQWIAACGDGRIRREFESLATLVEQTDPLFHPLLVRRRSLWRGKPIAEVVTAARLAMRLEPGFAAGRPLRTLSIDGIDTKFFERHGSLVTRLLDVRFDGEVSELGLETFLGAHAAGDHWLLVVDLDGTLLPFRTQRVRSSELRAIEPPGERLLIIENESCQHALPDVPGTIAILGAGFDLSWTEAEWLSNKRVAYWGDLDTWGLQFLAQARQAIGNLEALLMTGEIYDQHASAAVPEPVPACPEPPPGLTQLEQALYLNLRTSPKGRLEQEFLPTDVVQAAIESWCSARFPKPDSGLNASE